MKKRFNLFFLLFEDQRKNAMSEEARKRILEIVNQFFEKKKSVPMLPRSREERKSWEEDKDGRKR